MSATHSDDEYRSRRRRAHSSVDVQPATITRDELRQSMRVVAKQPPESKDALFVPEWWNRLPPHCLGSSHVHALLSRHASIDFEQDADDDDDDDAPPNRMRPRANEAASLSPSAAASRGDTCWAWNQRDTAQRLMVTVDRYLTGGGTGFANGELWDAAWSGLGIVMRPLMWSARMLIELEDRVDLHTIVRNRGVRRDDFDSLCRDVKRTLGDVEQSMNNFPRALYQLLLATIAYNPMFGYAQGMNMVAAGIVLNVREQWRQFWIFRYFGTTFLPHYWSRNHLGLVADERVLAYFVANRRPKLGAALLALEENAIIMLICRAWFARLFFGVLRTENTYRLWDQLVFGGARILFEFALRVLIYHRHECYKADTVCELFTTMTEWLGALDSLDTLLYVEIDRVKRTIDNDEVAARRASAMHAIATQQRSDQACYVVHISDDPTPCYVNGGRGCLCARCEDGAAT